MSDIAVEVSHVSKKFHRGEIHDSLRDLIPALAKRMMGRSKPVERARQGRLLGLKRRQLPGQEGRGPGHHWRQRRRQEHAPQNPGQDHQAHPRQHQDQRPPAGPDRGGGRLPRRPHRPREHLLERLDPGDEET